MSAPERPWARAFRLLPALDRSILWQLAIEHRSLADIATATGLDRGEVAVRGRDALRRMTAGLGGNPVLAKEV